MLAPETTRRLWTVYEPLHALIYFAPEARAAYAAAGLKGYWMGYFASRAAVLGPVPAPAVQAMFYSFAPHMVRRAIPHAWMFAAPGTVLAARLQAADEALRRLLPEFIGSPALAEAAELARRAIEDCDPAGRPLFGGHLALPWPEQPHLALWHACTLLREHRGDGHVAALLLGGLDGCEALVSFASGDPAWRERIRAVRGWADEEWDAAAQNLTERGWAGTDGRPSAAGVQARVEVERNTDRLALAPLERLGSEETERLYRLLLPLARAVIACGGVPIPNPIGLPEP